MIHNLSCYVIFLQYCLHVHMCLRVTLAALTNPIGRLHYVCVCMCEDHLMFSCLGTDKS